VSSISGDTCSDGSWVFYRLVIIAYVCGLPCLHSPTRFLQKGSPSKVARVFKIVIGGTGTCKTFIILEPWDVSAARDERYGMPTLQRDHTDPYFQLCSSIQGMPR
jgi:hypothetical protein